MRRSAPMRWLRLPAALLVALGLLLQSALPWTAAAMPAMAFGDICHSDGTDAPTPQPATKACDHCLLCQAGTQILPASAIPRPLPRLRIVQVVHQVPALPLSRLAEWLNYASRAPPPIG